tara:strand:- start:1397 stop:1642 length:246 start_codon:yes stop_codon:yes gene_type:complete
MSQYTISKARLAEIIKEEYETLNEEGDTTQTVARMIQEGDLDGAIKAIEAMKDIATAPSASPRNETVGSIRDMIRQELENL